MQGISSVLAHEIKGAVIAARDIDKASQESISIHVVLDATAPRELVLYLKELLTPDWSGVALEVDTLEEINCERHAQARDCALVVIGDNRTLAARVASHFSKCSIPVLMIAASKEAAPYTTEIKSTPDARVGLVVAQSYNLLASKIARWLCDTFVGRTYQLARAFSFTKDTVSTKTIANCASENALVALLPLGNADMPLMTANQIKMALSMRSMYGTGLSVGMFPEIAALVGAGFAFRAFTRLVPPASSLITFGLKVGVGYGGSYICGAILKNYYKVKENINLRIPIYK